MSGGEPIPIYIVIKYIIGQVGPYTVREYY